MYVPNIETYKFFLSDLQIKVDVTHLFANSASVTEDTSVNNT